MRARAAALEPVPIAFADLFDGLGTLDLAYRAAGAALHGRRVTLPGFIGEAHGRTDRFLLVDAPGACPECSPLPVPAVTLPELRRLPADVVAGRTAVIVDGRLGVGFEVDAAGEASFLRLSGVRILPRAGAPPGV